MLRLEQVNFFSLEIPEVLKQAFSYFRLIVVAPNNTYLILKLLLAEQTRLFLYP